MTDGRAGRRGEGRGQMPAADDKAKAADGRDISLHRRILEDVEGKILSGAWPPGYRIPFEHELTEEYQCSRMTVNKAITELVKRGLIERRRKSGSYVTHPHAQSAVLEIHDIRLEETAPGAWLIARVPWSAAEHRIRAIGADPRVAERLKIAPGTACLVVERRTWSGGTYITHVRLTYPGESHELVAEFSPSHPRE